MKEVFCGECKYYSCGLDGALIGATETCHHPKNKIVKYNKNHYGKYKFTRHLEIPAALNSDNKCEWFELKKWKKWWRIIKK